MPKKEILGAMFHEERALSVFGPMLDLYKSGRISWFRQDKLPQIKFFPSSYISEKSYSHQCWLFLMAILARAKQNADSIFKRALQQLESDPSDIKFFTPGVVANTLSIEEIKIFLFNITGNYLLEEFSKSWKVNSCLLNEKFEGQISNIFEGSATASDARKQLVQFSGIGNKIASLMMEWFEEIDLIIPPLYGSPPIDYHFARFALITGMVEIEKLKHERIRSDSIVKVIIPFFDTFCQKHKIAMSKLDPAVWLWSRNSCTQQKECGWCPVEKFCSGYFTYKSFVSKEGIEWLGEYSKAHNRQLYLFDALGLPKNKKERMKK